MYVTDLNENNLFDFVYGLCVLKESNEVKDIECNEDLFFAGIRINSLEHLEVIKSVLEANNLVYKVLGNKLMIKGVNSVKDIINLLS